MDKSISKILATIDDSISKFQGNIPALQKLIFDELQPLLKELSVKNGSLLNNVENLKWIGKIKSKLEQIIVNDDYKNSVKDFIKSFEQVTAYQVDYFKKFNSKFTPSKTLPIIRELAIDSTVQALLGQGMKDNLIAPVEKLLSQNITTGGSYAKLGEQLRQNILNDDSGGGTLDRYTKQITTDAIHQYNAQVHEAIAQDLQFNWGRYVGSLLTTSREFCEVLTKKQWVHKSQLPEIIHGDIEGHQCQLSKTTGLPLGMIPGTDPDNFKIRRGGYNCGHQFFWVPDSVVPADIRLKVPTATKPTMKPVETKPENEPVKRPKVAEAVMENNKADLAAIEKKGYQMSDDLFDLLGGEIKVSKVKKRAAHYDPVNKEIVIGEFPDRIESEYFRNTVMAHEIGHAIHNTKGIISAGKVNAEFEKHYKELRALVRGKESDIMDKVRQVRLTGNPDDNDREQLTVIADIIGSLTRGKHGYGHTTSYYRLPALSEAEIFAHGISLMKVSNKYSDITDEIKQVIEKMVAYSKGL